MTIFSTKFESWYKFFSPIKLVSLRQLAPSRNAVFNHQTGMDFVTEISFYKTPVVDEKRLVFRGWESARQIIKGTWINSYTASNTLSWSLITTCFTFCLVILHAIKCITNIQLQDVAAFLEEMETTEVLLDSVLKSQNSRVTVSAQLHLFPSERNSSVILFYHVPLFTQMWQ